MVNQKYLELINKDIDNNISAYEKELLDNYLKTNPEAHALHQDLFEIENLLDKLPENDPSENLKKRILSSIDFNRYASKKRKSIGEYFIAAFTGLRKKTTVSFAVGMVTGIIVLSIVFYASYYNNFPRTNNVFGTIGIADSELLKSVEVNALDIGGKIEIKKVANQYGVYVNLKSSKEYTLQIELDKSSWKVGNKSDNSPYSLLLSANESYPHKLLLKIFRDDSKLFERAIVLSKGE
jgi:hypothetical protein